MSCKLTHATGWPDRQFFDHQPSAPRDFVGNTFYARGNSGSIQTFTLWESDDLLVSLLAAKTDAQAETNNTLKTPLFFSCFSP